MSILESSGWTEESNTVDIHRHKLLNISHKSDDAMSSIPEPQRQFLGEPWKGDEAAHNTDSNPPIPIQKKRGIVIDLWDCFRFDRCQFRIRCN
jgi:hypothetical protein